MPHTLKLNYNEILKERFAKLYSLVENEVDSDLKYKKSEKHGAIAEHIHEEYCCKKIKRIRLGALNAENAIYVRDTTVLPADDYDIPLFCYDVVESDRWCFTTIDIAPVQKTDEYRRKYVDPIKPIYEKYCNTPSIEEMRQELPDWAKDFGSGFTFYLHYEHKYESVVDEAFNDYLGLYLKFVEEAEPLTDMDVKKEVTDYKKYYQKVYKENDPGFGPMSAFFGKEWTERLFKDFPF